MNATPTASVNADAFPIIALVGSAGGLQAAARVLALLPRDFAASIVVLIHVPPDRASHLVELISRRCSLPVVEADDGLPLLPGQVIVVPPGRHLLITPNDRVPATALIVSGAYPVGGSAACDTGDGGRNSRHRGHPLRRRQRRRNRGHRGSRLRRHRPRHRRNLIEPLLHAARSNPTRRSCRQGPTPRRDRRCAYRSDRGARAPLPT